jgi:hypothetical protein
MIPIPASPRVLRSRAKFLALTFAPVLLLISIAVFAPRRKSVPADARATQGMPVTNAVTPTQTIRTDNNALPQIPASDPANPTATNGTPSP